MSRLVTIEDFRITKRGDRYRVEERTERKPKSRALQWLDKFLPGQYEDTWEPRNPYSGPGFLIKEDGGTFLNQCTQDGVFFDAVSAAHYARALHKKRLYEADEWKPFGYIISEVR